MKERLLALALAAGSAVLALVSFFCMQGMMTNRLKLS
ncbi:hypothetical protein LAJLEIBI_02941 [[Clostridium] hylemonae DSM 15053]|nr:hypothetical protein LAJLEIBI_02941 [[Clostridium] hylemonae DSM 15053]